MLVLSRAVASGTGPGLLPVIGTQTGNVIHALLAGLGVSTVVAFVPVAFDVLRCAGAAYLLYLAWRIARADAAGASARARPIGFIEATLFTWMNPKAWVSALGAAAAFTTVGGNLLLESALIAGVLAAFCLFSAAVWAGFGTVIGRYLANPGVRRIFNGSMAGLLALSLIPVFWL